MFGRHFDKFLYKSPPSTNIIFVSVEEKKLKSIFSIEQCFVSQFLSTYLRDAFGGELFMNFMC